MILNLFQIASTILIALTALRLLANYKKGRLRFDEIVLSLVVWATGLTVVIFPAVTVRLANFFGIQRGTDLIIYSSVILLYLILSRFWLKLKDLEEKIGKIVSFLAVKEAKKKERRRGKA